MTVVRFVLVGITNTVVTLATYTLLVHIGAVPAVASAVGWVLGAANGYRLNRSWTFRSACRGPGTAARYAAVQALGALLSALAVNGIPVPKLAAEVLALPLVTIVTFTLSRRLVFGRPTLA